MIKRLAFAFCLLATPAMAGNITVTITNDAAAQVGTMSFPVTNANFARLLTWAKTSYGQVPSGPADPVTGIVPMRDRTNAEAISAWLTGFWQGTRDNIANTEKAAAASAATAGVVAIP